jgi:N-acetyl-anhydromuramyl-L-alanine amidase AmpD
MKRRISKIVTRIFAVFLGALLSFVSVNMESMKQSKVEAAALTAKQKTYANSLFAKLNCKKMYHKSFNHGAKPAKYQKYVVIHDTEGGGVPANVISGWASTGAGVAAHFVIGRDGSIVQAVPLDQITHHVGYGNKGFNKKYGVKEDGRDNMKGSVPIGSYYPDYGMNSYSIGIELIHMGKQSYTSAQLRKLNALIKYLDAVYVNAPYKNAGKIIQHKDWRTSNSDCSSVFQKYLRNYQHTRTATGVKAPKITYLKGYKNTSKTAKVAIKWSKVYGGTKYQIGNRTATKHWYYKGLVSYTKKNKVLYTKANVYKVVKYTKKIANKKNKNYFKVYQYRYGYRAVTGKGKIYGRTLNARYNKDYYMVVRAYNGFGNYSSWSNAVKVRVEK